MSILVRNFRNSVARCRRWVEVVTLPFEVSNAANNVVVPDGEMDPVLGCGALSGASSGSSANLGLATGGTPIVEVSGLIGPYASGTGRGRRIRPCRRTANRTSAARYLAVAALIGVVPQGIGLRDTKRKRWLDPGHAEATEADVVLLSRPSAARVLPDWSWANLMGEGRASHPVKYLGVRQSLTRRVVSAAMEVICGLPKDPS